MVENEITMPLSKKKAGAKIASIINLFPVL